LETAGVNPACIPTSSISAGEAGLPRGTPSVACAAWWRLEVDVSYGRPRISVSSGLSVEDTGAPSR